MHVFRIGIIAWLILCIPVAYAVEWSEPNAQEVKRLPDFCMVKYREHHGEPGALREGRDLMGPQFNNVHHYCNGLNFINRYYRQLGGQDAGSILSLAINEFTYMVDHPTPESPIRAEIFLQRGIAYSLARQYPEAANDLQRALTLNPKLVRAYSTLADNFEKIKARDKALEIVTEGLHQIPDSKALKRRYDELGGKQPYPEAAAIAPSPAPQQAEPQERPGNPATDQEPSGETSSFKEVQPEAAAQSGVSTTPPSDSKGPWCRFCVE